jgi:hypothetical protein
MRATYRFETVTKAEISEPGELLIEVPSLLEPHMSFRDGLALANGGITSGQVMDACGALQSVHVFWNHV